MISPERLKELETWGTTSLDDQKELISTIQELQTKLDNTHRSTKGEEIMPDPTTNTYTKKEIEEMQKKLRNVCSQHEADTECKHCGGYGCIACDASFFTSISTKGEG